MRAAIVLVVLALGGSALADGDPHEQAQRLFKDGQAAYSLGKYEEAITLYEQTYRLMRHPAFLYNIGQAYRRRWETEKKVEFLRRALSAYQSVLREDTDGKLKPDAEKFIGELSRALADEEHKELDLLLESGASGEELRVARKLLEDGRAAEARALLERLCRKTGTTSDVLAQAYLLRAKIAVADTDRAQALDLFKRALVLQPGIVPAEQHGPVSDAFIAAREALAGARLIVNIVPPGAVAAGEPAAVPVLIEADPMGMVDAHELRYRVAGTGAFSTARGKRGAALALPPAFLAGLTADARVEFFVLTLDANGAIVAQNGAELVPYVFSLKSPVLLGASTPSWYQKWWVWTIVGVAVAGAAGTTAYLATRPSAEKLLTIPATVNQ